MKPIKIAMLSLTHGHTRKYFQTLQENPKLEWVAVYAETEREKEIFLKGNWGIPCYLDEQELYDTSRQW